MVLFALAAPSLYFYLIFVFLIGFYLIVSYVIGVFGSPFDFKAHQKRVAENANYRPTIDVYLPSCGEDIAILENTYKAVKNLDWDSDKLKVYVLDDKGLADVAALSAKYGFEYISRPNKGELKKAGNLRYAFPLTKGEFIVIYDADFCPRPDMLKEMMPYFVDPKMSIVQSPQFFEIVAGQSWVEKGAAYVQELFYRLIQVNRDTWGASICVGTNAVYRRTALEPFGGTAAIGYSEDLHTGFNCIKTGWKLKYIPINLAKGICPDNTASYFIQQYRWAMGSTTLFFNPEFWQTKLKFMARLSYLSGMLYYMATAIGLFVTPIPGIVMAWFFPQHVYWYNWLFSIPSFIFGTFYMAFWTKAPFGWYALKTRILAYYAHLYALIDKLRQTTVPWVPSGDASGAKKVSRYVNFKNLLFWWASACFALSIAGAFYNMASLADPDYHYYPLVFFSCFNYWLNMTVLRDQLVD